MVGKNKYMTIEEKIKQAIKDIKEQIKDEEQSAEENDEEMGCCDKSFSDGLLDGLQSGLYYLKGLK